MGRKIRPVIPLVVADPAETLHALLPHLTSESRDEDWHQDWRQADARVRASMDAELSSQEPTDALSEGLLPRLLLDALPEDALHDFLNDRPAIASKPTGPPLNCSIIVLSTRRSVQSKPNGST